MFDDDLRDSDARKRAEEEIKKDLLLNDEDWVDPSEQAVREGGGGQSEGFELAEENLIRHASHGDDISDTITLTDAGRPEIEDSDAVYGEGDSARHPD